MNCKICNSEETVRSMAMHLKWNHKIKTNDYIKQYGEFRPKLLKNNAIKQQSHIKCEICQTQLMSHRQLIFHIREHKGITWQQYFVKYFFNGKHPLCKCGCGEKVSLLRHGINSKKEKAYAVEYIKGHWDWVEKGWKHTNETKEKMKNSAYKRMEKEKEKYGTTLWHSKESLSTRFKNNWEKANNRIMKSKNIICLDYKSDISNTQTSLYKFKCLKCNKTWEQISFYPNCQKCTPPSHLYSSNEEKEIVSFIKQLGFNPSLNDKQIISPFEIDIFIPELNIAIEYNGLYWHSESRGKNRQYHLNKTLKCKEKGIRLIQIFSDEWINKQEIVKSKLKTILGKRDDKKIYARKCIIKEIDNTTKSIFLNKYHIQGNDRSKIKLGLYYNDELASVITFSNPKIAIGKSKNPIPKSYELSRYASKCNVVGGVSKLLQYFITYYNPNYIYSYSDNRWSDWDNNMYLKIGFKLKNIGVPSYYYTKDYHKKYHRFNFNKGKLKKMGLNVDNLTEYEIMLKEGFDRIWDCGSAKYEWFPSPSQYLLPKP